MYVLFSNMIKKKVGFDFICWNMVIGIEYFEIGICIMVVFRVTFGK